MCIRDRFYLGGMGHLNNVSFLGQTITGGTIVAFYMYISKFFTPIQNLAEQFLSLIHICFCLNKRRLRTRAEPPKKFKLLLISSAGSARSQDRTGGSYAYP